jgi:hypothetical protein
MKNLHVLGGGSWIGSHFVSSFIGSSMFKLLIMLMFLLGVNISPQVVQAFSLYCLHLAFPGSTVVLGKTEV